MCNLRRLPIRDATSLLLIHVEDMRLGYASALRCEPEPDSWKSYSFWHGWRMGMIESHQLPTDVHYQKLKESIKTLLSHKTNSSKTNTTTNIASVTPIKRG